MRCQQCEGEIADGLLICPHCGGNAGAGSTVAATVVETPAAATVTCAACGQADQPVDRPFCGRCVAPLGAPGPALPARLVFADGNELRLEPGTEVKLGRDPDLSPAGRSLDVDTVSRVHATVGRDRAGAVWVREENATNRTWVNERELPGGSTVPLRDGDQLRLSSAVVVRLRIG